MAIFPIKSDKHRQYIGPIVSSSIDYMKAEYKFEIYRFLALKNHIRLHFPA